MPAGLLVPETSVPVALPQSSVLSGAAESVCSLLPVVCVHIFLQSLQSLLADAGARSGHRWRGALQVAPYDPRHTIYTISRAQRHAQYQGSDIRLHVYEDEPEVLARHMLLLAIFLDEALLPKDRMLKFLEVFGNSLLRADTHAYLCTKCLEMEQLVTSARAPDTVLGRLFSLSDLKYTDRDGLVDAFKSFRAVKEYDVAKAWDTRCRHWYGDRYDFRKNMVRSRYQARQ